MCSIPAQGIAFLITFLSSPLLIDFIIIFIAKEMLLKLCRIYIKFILAQRNCVIAISYMILFLSGKHVLILENYHFYYFVEELSHGNLYSAVLIFAYFNVLMFPVMLVTTFFKSNTLVIIRKYIIFYC